MNGARPAAGLALPGRTHIRLLGLPPCGTEVLRQSKAAILSATGGVAFLSVLLIFWNTRPIEPVQTTS